MFAPEPSGQETLNALQEGALKAITYYGHIIRYNPKKKYFEYQYPGDKTWEFINPIWLREAAIAYEKRNQNY